MFKKTLGKAFGRPGLKFFQNAPLQNAIPTLGFSGGARFSAWSPERETSLKVPRASDIINEKNIYNTLAKTRNAAKDKTRVREILQKAWDRALLKEPDSCKAGSEYVQGLDLEETATLLNIDSKNNPELLEELCGTALKIKELIYGNRIVLFAPLYFSNYCVGSCLYCGYRAENRDMDRSSLTDEQVVENVTALENIGHKRLLVLSGESPRYGFKDFVRQLELASSVKTPPHGEIRRINVEIPPLSISDMRTLKETGCVGTYTAFQETYNRAVYKKMHPYGPKADYDWRATVMDRAQLAGIDDNGIGALFGLYDYKFDVLGLLMHSMHLDKNYGTGPHTISIPRIQPASNAPFAKHIPHAVNDEDFTKLVATLRCAVPYTGMILSTRETPEMRMKCLQMGISQMSAGSKTDIGGYEKEEKDGHHDTPVGTTSSEGQFELADTRPAEIVIRELLQKGFIPSWCTACYRVGRTGEAFMDFAKRGLIHNFCQPNALLTLAEYLIDYATDTTREIGWKVIEREAMTITSKSRRETFMNKLNEIKKKDQRDLYF